MSDLKNLKSFTVTDPFFERYVSIVREEMLPYQEKALKDEIEGAEKSHCIENFRMAAEKLKTGECGGEFYGMVFQDSDVGKWLEGEAYSLLKHPDPEVERRCDEIIELIAAAQHPDGYINTYFTVKEPEKRWSNLQEAHELYCLGHLIEAAVAYSECTGKTRLLEIMRKAADNAYERFITKKAPGYPGHPEVELALIRLYRATGEERYKELSLHFLNTRGVDSDYYIKESEARGWNVWGNNPYDREYTQSDRPVRELSDATGHAVRAVYLYTGMAMVAAETGDSELFAACKRLWDSITSRRMYVTGGIGSAYEGEAFTRDYHLPNDTAYSETCASIGLSFFAKAMLETEKSSRYSDVMERAIYNCVLAGMQLDGKSFFYVNPLEVIPGLSGAAKTHFHTLPVRPKWFACACCPPNVARLLSSLAEYEWSVEKDTVYSHLFIGGTLDLSERFGGSLILDGDYAYGGKIRYRFRPTDGSMKLTLALRLPDWSEKTEILLNGEAAAYTERDGYAYISGEFTAENEITVSFDMSVKRIYADSRVFSDNGRVALQRGPFIYCAEGIDNGDELFSMAIKDGGEITASPYNREELCGAVALTADGYILENGGGLYSYGKKEPRPCKIRLIPYYAWGNRGLTKMRVWIPEK